MKRTKGIFFVVFFGVVACGNELPGDWSGGGGDSDSSGDVDSDTGFQDGFGGIRGAIGHNEDEYGDFIPLDEAQITAHELEDGENPAEWEPDPEELFGPAFTDGDGVYEICVPAGRYIVEVYSSEGAYTHAFSGAIEVAEGEWHE